MSWRDYVKKGIHPEPVTQDPEPPPRTPEPEPSLTIPRRAEIGRNPDGSCYHCGSSDFCKGRYREVCRVCHPPAPGAEVSEHRGQNTGNTGK